ncbi:MAG: hypothetical protein IPK95_10545 [Cellvibrionales bacterium]|nr:hypothetical protein [Cellvibrionales bacterium]
MREEEEVEIEEFHEEQSFEQRAHQELLQAINTNLKPLKNLAPAIWVLVVVIVQDLLR